MSADRKRNPEAPPEPAPMRRSLSLRPLQIFGIVALASVPILGVTGLLGDRWVALEMIGRVAFVYLFLMVAFRFTGKRELGEMSPFEFVTLMIIPEIFSVALNRNDSSLTSATIAVATLFVLVIITGLITFRFQRAERVIEGEPTILVRNGQFLHENLRRERISPDEVMPEIHKAGLEDVSAVRWAILEVDGHISIVPRPIPASKANHASG